MNRQKIKSGDLIRIPLWNSLGYGYAKYIDLSKISGISYTSLIRVYDYWSKNKEIEIEEIQKCNYLIQPLFVAGILPTLQQGAWEIIGNIGTCELDFSLPCFKGWGPVGVNEYEAKKWYYFTEGKLSNKFEASYENVKHLELFGAHGTGDIEMRITFQILIKEGLTVSDYFDLENETFSYQYRKALEIPLLSKLPPELWGKAKV